MPVIAYGVYGTVSGILLAILFFATFPSEAEQRRQVQLVVFGDSMSTGIGDLTPVPEMLSERLGLSVYNASMGGTCAARLEEERRLDSGKGTLSLAGLTKAVRGRDFRVQRSAKLRGSNMEPFPEIVEGLAAVDFRQVETVLLQRGINDYHAGTALENPEDSYDEYTFLGALRSAVADLRRANPGIRILLVTPTYGWYLDLGQTCEELDNGGGLLEDYVIAELGLAQELGVEAVDLYYDFYPHESWEDWERYTLDGIHPNEAGREKIAQAIVEALRD